MGLAIQYTFYRINTQQGGLRPLVELPLGFDVNDVALSPVTDRLAVSGVEYELIEGMRGTETVQFLSLENAIEAYTQIVDANSGEPVQNVPSGLYGLSWTPDGETLRGYANNPNESTTVSIETGEITPLALSGDILPESTYFLAWQSNTAYLVHNGYGFDMEVSDFGIWSIDVMNGEVSRLR